MEILNPVVPQVKGGEVRQIDGAQYVANLSMLLVFLEF